MFYNTPEREDKMLLEGFGKLGKSIISKPERIDMTELEVDALLNKSMDEVLEDSTFSNSNDNNEENIDLESDKININSNKKKKTSTRSRKNVSNDE